MTAVKTEAARRLLDPIERVSEVLFGLIMALTFTGTLSAATAGHEEVRSMLIGAIGCNIAWGLVDAVMYLLTRTIERGRAFRMFKELRGAADKAAAHQLISDALPPLVAGIVEERELESLRTRLSSLQDPGRYPTLTRDDWLAALGVFLLVCLSTFPVVLPFLFVGNAMHAIRISNAVSIVMLFLCGFQLGRYSGQNKWGLGAAMAVIGIVLSALTIVLGG